MSKIAETDKKLIASEQAHVDSYSTYFNVKLFSSFSRLPSSLHFKDFYDSMIFFCNLIHYVNQLHFPLLVSLSSRLLAARSSTSTLKSSYHNSIPHVQHTRVVMETLRSLNIFFLFSCVLSWHLIPARDSQKDRQDGRELSGDIQMWQQEQQWKTHHLIQFVFLDFFSIVTT